MKKTSKLVILALLVVGAIMTLCACGLIATAQAIEIVNPPKQDYVVTDTAFDWTGFQIKVIKQDGTPAYYTYEDLEKEATFVVSEFDNTPGKHTAIITYMGVSVAFEYTVNEGLFAGGDGTEANPYQISTVEQFLRLRGKNWNGAHFELINDIDFNRSLEEYAPDDKKDVATEETKARSGRGFIFNGNDYALINVNYALFESLGGEKYTVVNTEEVITVFSNVDVYLVEEGRICYSMEGKEARIENVNIYGSMELSETDPQTGVSPIVNKISATTSVLESINVYADIITYSRYASPFIGAYPTSTNQSVTLRDCDFYGKIQAIHVGLFFGNNNAGVRNKKPNKNGITYSISNVNNSGTFICAVASYFGFTNYTLQTDNAAAKNWNEGTLANFNQDPIAAEGTFSAENSDFTYTPAEGQTGYTYKLTIHLVAYRGNYGEKRVTVADEELTLSNGVYSCSDVKFVKWSFGTVEGDAVYDASAGIVERTYFSETKGITSLYATYVVWIYDSSDNIVGVTTKTLVQSGISDNN